MKYLYQCLFPQNTLKELFEEPSGLDCLTEKKPEPTPAPQRTPAPRREKAAKKEEQKAVVKDEEKANGAAASPNLTSDQLEQVL